MAENIFRRRHRLLPDHRIIQIRHTLARYGPPSLLFALVALERQKEHSGSL
jgi:hypothetical protein